MILKFEYNGLPVVYDEVEKYRELGFIRLKVPPKRLTEGFSQKDIREMWDEYLTFQDEVTTYLISDNIYSFDTYGDDEPTTKEIFSRQFNMIRFNTTYGNEYTVLFNEHCWVCNNKGNTIGKVLGRMHNVTFEDEAAIE